MRNGSSVVWVIYNFVNDFPQGRRDADGAHAIVSPLALNDPVIIFGIQAFFLTLSMFGSAWAIMKTVANWEPQRKFSTAREAKIAGLMMLIISFGITMFNMYFISGPAVA